jgi:carboxymethylenebutenolidase
MERIRAADGHELDCAVIPAQGARRGGVVVLQEIFGLTDQLGGIGARYAAMGYGIAMPALFDRRERGAVIPFDQAPLGRTLMDAVPLEETMLDIAAAVDRLARDGGRVAVIGFCWGGGLALRAAQLCDIAGAVGFYGTRLTRYLDDDLKAPVLMHYGAEDDHVPEAMRAAVADRFPGVESHLYAAGHAFANEARPSFVAQAAALAHERTAAFLARVMG